MSVISLEKGVCTRCAAIAKSQCDSKFTTPSILVPRVPLGRLPVTSRPMIWRTPFATPGSQIFSKRALEGTNRTSGDFADSRPFLANKAKKETDFREKPQKTTRACRKPQIGVRPLLQVYPLVLGPIFSGGALSTSRLPSNNARSSATRSPPSTTWKRQGATPVRARLHIPLHTKGLPNRTLLFSNYFGHSCVITEPNCFWN